MIGPLEPHQTPTCAEVLTCARRTAKKEEQGHRRRYRERERGDTELLQSPLVRAMAEDEGFGDFKFVTAFDPNPNSTQQRQSAVSDDDWGDFVTDATSQIKTHVVLSNGFAHSQSPPPAQVPADPFVFFNINITNGSATPPTSTGSDSIRVETKPEAVSKTQWEKPRGALPLSLFGEEERDEQTAVNHDATELTNSEGFEKKVSNLNDLISNFYVQNGSNPNSGSGGPNSGLNLSSNGKLDGMNLTFGGSDLKFEGMDSNSNSSALKLNTEEGNEEFDDDDDGWEFKAAESDHRVSNENSKVTELLNLLIRIAETNCLCFCLFILFYNYCWQEQGVVEVAELKVESNTFVHHRGIQAGIVYCCMTCLLIVLLGKKKPWKIRTNLLL